jgi:hypothetical protein
MSKQTDALAEPGVALAADTATWVIDANTLRCVDQQETNLTKGDEVYIASILFRTKPGVAGSTKTAFHGGLVDITNINTGETHAIPDGMGRVPFPNVTRLGATEIFGGQSPEVLGTATIVMESDLSGNQKVNNLFTEAAADARPVIAEVSENLSFEDVVSNPDELAAVLKQLAKDLKEAVEPTFAEKLALFITSLGDPDDPVGNKLNVFVALDDVLGGFADPILADALPASIGVVGALHPRTYSQRFAGKGAIYDVTFNVAKA